MKKRALIVFVGFVVGITLSLYGAELYAKTAVERISYRNTVFVKRPPPYQNSPYWSAEFIQERLSIAQHIISIQDGNDLKNYESLYYNITNGGRLTVGQPANYTNTIYLFGSSTIFNEDVPDQYTIASQLQQLVGSQYRVENRGIVALIDGQVERRIEATEFIPGDIVIFYEGWNDLGGVLNASREAHKTPICRALELLPYVNESALATLACNWDSPLQADDQQRIGAMGQAIVQTVLRAQSYVEGSNAHFFYITPPLLWAKPNPSSYEQQMLGMSGKIDTMPDGFLRLGEQIPSIDLSKLNPLDLYHFLDHQDNVFVTHLHLNERGDGLIAQAIYDLLVSNHLPVNPQ